MRLSLWIYFIIFLGLPFVSSLGFAVSHAIFFFSSLVLSWKSTREVNYFETENGYSILTFNSWSVEFSFGNPVSSEFWRHCPIVIWLPVLLCWSSKFIIILDHCMWRIICFKHNTYILISGSTLASEFWNFHVLSIFKISCVRHSLVGPFSLATWWLSVLGNILDLLCWLSYFLFSFWSSYYVVCWTGSSNYLLSHFPSFLLVLLSGKAEETLSFTSCIEFLNFCCLVLRSVFILSVPVFIASCSCFIDCNIFSLDCNIGCFSPA